jgi:hypothetical protein
VPEHHQSVGLYGRCGFGKNRVDDRVDGQICAKSQRNQKDCYGAQHGTVAEYARGMPDILQQLARGETCIVPSVSSSTAMVSPNARTVMYLCKPEHLGGTRSLRFGVAWRGRVVEGTVRKRIDRIGLYELLTLSLRLSRTFARIINAADLIRLWRKHQMKSITRLVTAVVAVMFAVATLCPAQDVKPTDLGKGAAFNGKKIEMKDKGEVNYLLSFTGGKEFEATTDGLKNTDVHLFVYDSTGAEVAKDDSPGPKCSVKVTPMQDGQYKFVIKNAGGANTVTFNVKVAK